MISNYRIFDDDLRAYATGILILGFMNSPETNFKGACQRRLTRMQRAAEMLADASDSAFHHECIASGFTMVTTIEGREVRRPISVLLHDDYDADETNPLIMAVEKYQDALDLSKDIAEVRISDEDRIYKIAMAVMAKASPQGFYCIDYIAVDPALRGLGLGKQTLEEAEKMLTEKEIFLYTTQPVTS